MDVKTIVVDPDLAIAKLKEYRSVAVVNRRKEDADFRRLYRAATKGKPILDVAMALKASGLSEAGWPKLALARANWPEVHFSVWHKSFSSMSWPRRGKVNSIYLPQEIYDWNRTPSGGVFSPVPFIPPALRPEDDLGKYHILFEVTNWQEYPADPFLLRQIAGWLFIVVGEWDLTELERAILRGHIGI